MGIRERGVTDEHRVSELGRLFSEGEISRGEYRIAISYGITILDYLKTIDAPSPYGSELASIPDEVCLERKLEMAAARTALNKAGRKAAMVVDCVAVYGEPLRDGELSLLRAGLQALREIKLGPEPIRDAADWIQNPSPRAEPGPPQAKQAREDA